MRIFILDDEKMVLQYSEQVIRSAVPGAEIDSFLRASQALDAIRSGGKKPDAVFCDIEMPGMSGLEFAVQLKKMCPDARLIFVTGYSQYALEAYQVHASGYVLKPLDQSRVREELEGMPVRAGHMMEPKGELFIRCFGNFEAFWQGKPLHFSRQKTKEMLAYLVDRRGSACTAEEVIAVLWEDENDMKHGKTRLRQLVSDLRTVLKEIGREGLLIRTRNQAAVDPEMFDCDYYRMLEGDMDAVNAFRGEYMAQYSWAEITSAELYFRK